MMSYFLSFSFFDFNHFLNIFFLGDAVKLINCTCIDQVTLVVEAQGGSEFDVATHSALVIFLADD